MSLELLIGNDNAFQYNNVVDETGAYQNSASITVTLQDSDGVELTGQTWPLTLAYVVGSNANYLGIISANVVLSPGVPVYAIVDGTSGGKTLHIEALVYPKVRTS